MWSPRNFLSYEEGRVISNAVDMSNKKIQGVITGFDYMTSMLTVQENLCGVVGIKALLKWIEERM